MVGIKPPVKVHEQRIFMGSVPNTRIMAFKKPYKEPPDTMIMKTTKRNELRETYAKYVNDHEYYKFLGINDYKNDLTMIRNVMKRKLQSRCKEFEDLLDKKRERLAHLLQTEDEGYHAEFETLFPTNEEKLTAFMKKVHAIKRDKEIEKNAIATELYEKRWTKNCDPLRDRIRSLTHKACAEDNLKTAKWRDISRNEQKQDDIFLMNMLDKKLAAEDAAREDKQREHKITQRKAAQKNLEIAQEKHAARIRDREVEKEDGLRILENAKEEERLAKEEQLKLRKYHEQCRKDVELQIRMHESRKEMDKKVTEMMNAKFQEHAKRIQENEEKKQKSLRDQLTKAKDFADKIQKLEEGKSKELEDFVIRMQKEKDRKINEDIRKTQERAHLLILDSRQQCARLLALKEEEKEEGEKEMEKEAMKKLTEEIEAMNKKNLKLQRLDCKAHQQDILSQIAYNQHLKDCELEEKKRERERMQQAEAEYTEKIAKALADAAMGNVHPFRAKYMAEMAAEGNNKK